ncbi:MAG: DUF4145 domain-containing protein [Gemmatimonadetes bacterium]|nr:DUF4145 domain-containing protein [Gemmatimonadota bacterium]
MKRREILSQLDALIETGRRLIDSYELKEFEYESSVPEVELRAFVTSALAAIERIAGKDSPYNTNIPESRVSSPLAVDGLQAITRANLHFMPTVTGVLISLRDAVDQGLLQSLESRLRANIHDDFLVQASELLDAGFHVAAIVLIGGVLEDHLRKMVQGQGLPLPKNGSISKYNDLLRKNTYYQSVWRRIQSIGDLRNDAAHGKASNITAEDVNDAHNFVQRFITDHPA